MTTAGLLVFSFSLLHPVAAAGALQFCPVPTQFEDVALPLLNGTDAACLVSETTSHPTTSKRLDAVRSYVPRELFDFLQDRLDLTARLAKILEVDDYFVEKLEPGLYNIDDREGTVGAFRLVYQDDVDRVYLFNGTHKGTEGQAVVFLKNRTFWERGREVQVSIVVVFTRAKGAVTHGLGRILSPFLSDAVADIAARGLIARAKLSELVAREPARVAEAVQQAELEPAEKERLIALIRQAAGR